MQEQIIKLMQDWPIGLMVTLEDYNSGLRAKIYREAVRLGMDFAIIRGNSGSYYLIRVE